MKKILAALLLVLLAATSALAAGKTVYFYNWTEYLPESLLKQFTKETGIKVVYSTYDSNEAMYAKIKMLGGGGYDLIVPSAYFVSKMRREGLLLPLDKARLTNWKNLDPDLLDKPFDPGNQFSMPYNWGGTGIVYDTSKIKAGSVTSWADLWTPEAKGKLIVQDDPRDLFGMALIRLGRSINETDPVWIEKAFEMLKTLVPSIKAYNSDSPKTPFLNREAAIGLIWNGEAQQARLEIGSLEFVWPKEGPMFWMDCLAIPKNAKNPENALALMNFLLRPEVAKVICEQFNYPTPNKAAYEILPAALKNNKTVFPPRELVKNGQFQDDVGAASALYEQYWNRLKTGK